jgi:hypothetical protein
MTAARYLLAAPVVAALLAGCARQPPPPIIPVEGVVWLDGEPLKKVEVRFIPQIDFGPEYIATGVTDEKGRFSLTCNGQPGACAGENRVLILESEIPAKLKGEEAQVALAKYFEGLGGRPIPPRYGNLAESPFTVTVTTEKKEYFASFDLKR